MTRKKNRSFDMQVGVRLRQAMEKAGLTPDKTAAKMGKSTAQIFRYLSGDTHVEPADLARMAQIFHCKAGDFLNGLEVSK